VLDSGGPVKEALDSYIEGFKARGKNASPLGCHQGGPGCIFGKPYKPGSVFDYVVEGFAGTHDFLNHPVYYNSDGTSKALSGFSRRYGQFRNVTNVFLAAPIVLPSLIPDQLRYLALTEFD
jgi:filamentous hemagglutinin